MKIFKWYLYFWTVRGKEHGVGWTEYRFRIMNKPIRRAPAHSVTRDDLIENNAVTF